MVYHAVTLRPCDLVTLKVVVHQASRDQSMYEIWAKSSNPRLNYSLRICAHVLSRHDLDLWPHNLELLQHFGCHAFKLCTKFERNRIIHGWVITIQHVFACNFTGWVTADTAFSEVHAPNFTKLGQDIGRSAQHCTFVSEFGSDILLHFQTRVAQSLVMLKTTPNFALLDRVKIRGEVGSSPRNRCHPPPPPVNEAPSRSQSMNHRLAADCAPCCRR